MIEVITLVQGSTQALEIMLKGQVSRTGFQLAFNRLAGRAA